MEMGYIYMYKIDIAKSGLSAHISLEFAVIRRRSRTRIGNEGVMPSA